LLLGDGGVSVHVGGRPEAAWEFVNLSAARDLAVLTGPLPASHGCYVAEAVSRILNRLETARLGRRRLVDACFREAQRALPWPGMRGRGRLLAPVYLEAGRGQATAVLRIQPGVLEATVSGLQGRVLLDEQALKAVAATGNFSIGQAAPALDAACAAGLVRFHPAVGIDIMGRYVCNRCGAAGRIYASPCWRCGMKECHMCSECSSMGPARECMALYSVPGPGAGRRPGDPDAAGAWAGPQYDYELTPVQKAAMEQCKQWYCDGDGGELLVWAVCGAGKTEVAFGAIGEALRRGVSAAFAVPRRDVAAEVFQRVQEAFPDVEAAAFFGGSSERRFDSPLTVLTCHQAMRFVGRFSLAVLDEADAYPYVGSEALAFSLRRSIAPGGKLMIMTATPSAGHVEMVRSGAIPVVRISARHHCMPLPVPQVDAGRRGAPMEARVLEAVARSVEAGWPVFVFTPTRARCMELFSYLSRRLGGVAVDWAHSGRRERDDVRTRFARGKVQVLVCTSVMERGVTVAGADVVVVHADAARVFDHRALVQMAGRAGRASSRPEGNVTFVCDAVTPAIRMAVSVIEEMNEHARAMGYLRA